MDFDHNRYAYIIDVKQLRLHQTLAAVQECKCRGYERYSLKPLASPPTQLGNITHTAPRLRNIPRGSNCRNGARPFHGNNLILLSGMVAELHQIPAKRVAELVSDIEQLENEWQRVCTDEEWLRMPKPVLLGIVAAADGYPFGGEDSVTMSSISSSPSTVILKRQAREES